MTTPQLAIAFVPDHRSLRERFEAFHATNPHVFVALETMALKLYHRDPARRFGIGMLYEVLRYRTMIQTKGDDYKLNNDYRSHYARLLLEQHPELAEVLETRKLRAA